MNPINFFQIFTMIPQLVQAVQAIMASDALRSYRIDIETDSTIQADLGRSQQNMTNFVQGLAAFGDAVGDTNYYVTINAGVGTDPNELGRVVVKAIKTYERRNGPVFASA